jgi:hypothetical protein
VPRHCRRRSFARRVNCVGRGAGQWHDVQRRHASLDSTTSDLPISGRTSPWRSARTICGTSPWNAGWWTPARGGC